MKLTKSPHSVVDAFGQRHVSPLDWHRHRLPHYRHDPISDRDPFGLAVQVDKLLAIDSRYR